MARRIELAWTPSLLSRIQICQVVPASPRRAAAMGMVWNTKDSKLSHFGLTVKRREVLRSSAPDRLKVPPIVTVFFVCFMYKARVAQH